MLDLTVKRAEGETHVWVLQSSGAGEKGTKLGWCLQVDESKVIPLIISKSEPSSTSIISSLTCVFKAHGQINI